MFSHLLGNLIMGDLDREYGSGRTVRYFRYVDDIVLIGPRDAVHRLHADLVARLDDLGLNFIPLGRRSTDSNSPAIGCTRCATCLMMQVAPGCASLEIRSGSCWRSRKRRNASPAHWRPRTSGCRYWTTLRQCASGPSCGGFDS